MKTITSSIIYFLLFMILSISTLQASAAKSIYDLQLTSIRGKEISLDKYKGNVALVVNTASKCGFRSQFGGLEKLYQKFKDKGFVILGFPSNDFVGQEPRDNLEIAEYCKINYGVTFPLFEKGHVKGEHKQDMYKLLTEESSEELQGDPGWNFVKFIVDKNGVPRKRFSSVTGPSSKAISETIEKLLEEQ